MAQPAFEQLQGVDSGLGRRGGGPEMLVIVNPYASTVSDQLKSLVVNALKGRYRAQAVETQSPGHAVELSREAARQGVDVVVAFGGDGTVTEVANGLAGTETALTCLPGGSNNVFHRLLGIPTEIVEATEHLLCLGDRWQPRRIDLGKVAGRHFTFAAGVGLDAAVVQRVDASPHLKARYKQMYFAQVAVSTFVRHYLISPPRLIVEAGASQIAGVTAVVQNGPVYTYFNGREIRLAEGVDLDSGDLAGAVLGRANLIDMPTVAYRAISKRAAMAGHRQIHPFSGVGELRVVSADRRKLPLHVDGDYLGLYDEVGFEVDPGALLVVG